MENRDTAIRSNRQGILSCRKAFACDLENFTALIAEPDKLSVDGEEKITFHPSLSGYRSAGLYSNRTSRHRSRRVSGIGRSALYLRRGLDSNSTKTRPQQGTRDD